MAGARLRRGGIIEGLNVTPLVDITLVLLVIFIVTAKMVVSPAVPLDLPVAASGHEVQTIFSVIVTADGVARVDGRVSTDEDLAAAARSAVSRDRELRAVLNADGSVPHRRVIAILDLLKSAGIGRVAFGAVPRTNVESATSQGMHASP